MEYIDNIYFNELIEKNICNKDLIRIDTNNETNEIYSGYYIYNCYNIMIEGRDEKKSNINYFEKFPNIIFNSQILGINFEFKKEDLFKLIFSRYYFRLFSNIIIQQKKAKKMCGI